MPNMPSAGWTGVLEPGPLPLASASPIAAASATPRVSNDGDRVDRLYACSLSSLGMGPKRATHEMERIHSLISSTVSATRG